MRTSPVTGRQELVIFGGYRNGALAEMHPYTLDLTTFCWSSMHGLGGVLPAPRQRTACMRVTEDWLLMLAGGPMQVSCFLCWCCTIAMPSVHSRVLNTTCIDHSRP